MQPELNLYVSNRLEILAQQLARIVKEPLPAPIVPEIVVVQSRGMERWISMALAMHNGICANTIFPFPNTFLQQMTINLIPDLPDQSLFAPTVLTFRIMKILPACTAIKGFESLKSYLENDIKHLKLYQISKKIADIFDQYLVFRPDMVFDWEQGRQNHWQAKLWRRLMVDKKPMHRAHLQAELLDRITRPSDALENMPDRISIFGISYLPPFYLKVFEAVSKLTQVNFFMMNPCREYWADIASDREMKKIRKSYPGADETDADLYLEKGNRLLASMGTLGRNFFKMISELECRTYEQFETPAEKDILSGIQADILTLKDREISNDSDASEHTLPDASLTRVEQDVDDSIQVHSCHSPLREIEILHDNLLAMFEQDPDLAPRDIVVMTPDIESYNPYIQAVFDAHIDDKLKIPFSIADQGVRKLCRAVDGFFTLLDLHSSRVTATDVMALLEFESIRDKFDFSETDIQVIENWIKATNIRWGIDAQSRQKLGLPKVSDNTWKAGIERLLMGYALPGNNCRMFSGILPYDHIEGSDVKTLGKFLEFVERVFSCIRTLQQKHTLINWSTIFLLVLDQFLAADEASETQIQLLRRLFDDLSENQKISGFDKAVEIEVVKSHLESLLEHEQVGTGFIASGVTFCAMLPMRSIPFKVVCLVGLNSDTFPRQSKSVSFDLMIQNPRIGDRSKRNDDKYMFLEAILSARKKLYISYVGQSVRDNAQSPPSVMVSELLDYMEAGFGLTAGQAITRHKLQAFALDYFRKDSRLFSYSSDNFDAVSKRHASRKAAPLISKPLNEPDIEWKNIRIDALCAFFSNPAKFLLEQRLGIYLTETAAISEDKEPFSLDGLQKYLLDQDLVADRLTGSNLKEFLPIYRAKGELPHGMAGDLLYDEMRTNAEMFVRKIESIAKGKPLKAITVDLGVADFILYGRLADMHKEAQIQVRYTTLKPKYLLNTWIYHLVLCALDDPDYPGTSLLICKDAAREFRKTSNSRNLLQDLLALYWQGMSKPLPFFPELSYDFAQRVLIKKQADPIALMAVRKKWIGSDYARGVSEDQYYDICFRGIEPLDDSFEKMARDVFAPLLDHCTEIVL